MCDDLKLTPCPFCACKEVYKHDIALHDAYGEGYVLCPSCKVQVYFMIPRADDMKDRYDVIPRIVSAWNRRDKSRRKQQRVQQNGLPIKCRATRNLIRYLSDCLRQFSKNKLHGHARKEEFISALMNLLKMSGLNC